LVVEDAASGVEAALAAQEWGCRARSSGASWRPVVRESLSGVGWVVAALKQTQMFASTTMPVASHRPQWDGIKAAGFIWTTTL